MARKQPRDARGRFVKRSKARSRRKNPTRKRRARNQPRDRFGRFVSKGRSRSRRSSRRRNPPASGLDGFAGFLADGAINASLLTTAKIGARMAPGFVNQSRTSNVGLAVQIAAAVGLAYLADNFVGSDYGPWVLAGGLTGPLEDAALRFGVPYVGDALRPGTVGLYASPPRARVGSGRIPANRRISGGGMRGWQTPHVGNRGVFPAGAGVA